jgi:phenylacetate-coenzyme A ligase PaaK-like adenylate-forming protein
MAMTAALHSLPPARDAVAPLVQRRAQTLLTHASEASPLYRERLRGWRTGISPWAAIEPAGKRELMARFDDWVTDRAITLAGAQAFVADPRRAGDDFLGRYAVWASSGTTGEPGLFVHDAFALSTYAMLTALRMDSAHWMSNLARGLWQSGGRAVLLAALDGHYAGVSFWRLQCRRNPWMAARAKTLSVLLPAHELCAELNAFGPSFVASYPSTLSELARLQAEARLHISPVALWAGGERLTPSAHAHIEQVFGDAHVVNDYGASECLSMAFECPQGRLHLNDDWVLLEPVDRQYRPVPPGEASHSVLLTNLANRAQPLIRYDLGDSVTLFSDPCPCGNPRPSLLVEGRCDDTLHLRDPSRHVVRLSPMALATAVEERADVHRFQLRQVAPAAIELRVDTAGVPAADAACDKAMSALRNYLEGQGLPNVRLRFDPAPPQPDAPSGKLRQVVCAMHETRH